MEGVDDVALICPHHVHRCCNRKQRCKHAHPHVPKTTDTEFLVSSTARKSKFPVLVGVGLQAWIDVNSICDAFIGSGCKKANCQWWHPTADLTKALKNIKIDYSMECSEKVVDVFVKLDAKQGRKHALMPAGFGLCVARNEALLMNVRLVAILANVVYTYCKEAECRPILLRMCRAAYRYPDGEALVYIKKTLEVFQRKEPDQFKTMSYKISEDVDGGATDRCLLTEVLGTKKATQVAPTRIVQRGDSKVSHYPAAPTVSTKQQQQQGWWKPKVNQVNHWGQASGLDLFTKPAAWAPTVGGAMSSPALQPHAPPPPLVSVPALPVGRQVPPPPPPPMPPGAWQM